MRLNNRQSTRSAAPLVINEPDLFWKVWTSNRHLGVETHVISARRASGCYSCLIVFRREGKDGVPVRRYWVKEHATEEQVLQTANELMSTLADRFVHFRLVDLSGIRTLGEQLKRLQEEGVIEVTGTCEIGKRRPG